MNTTNTTVPAYTLLTDCERLSLGQLLEANKDDLAKATEAEVLAFVRESAEHMVAWRGLE